MAYIPPDNHVTTKLLCPEKYEADFLSGILRGYSESSILSLMTPTDNHLSNDLNVINNDLISYVFVISVLEDALCSFLYKKYRLFDALVGNNSCYLVSYIIFLIAHKFNSDDRFVDEVKRCLGKIKNIKKEILLKTNCFMMKIDAESLVSYLTENGLNLNLHIDFSYLAMAYGCTQSKSKNELEFEETDYEKLIEIYNRKLNLKIKRKSVQKLVKHWQKMLSNFNVKTLQSHTKNALNEKDKLWAKYVSDEKYILEDRRGRLCTPSLYSAATIYNIISTIPGAVLGLQVNLIECPKNYICRFTIFYEVQIDGSLRKIESDKFSSAQPMYVFSGCRYVPDGSKINIEEIKKEFATRDLRTLILAHEVTYPQYPKSLNAPNILPIENEMIAEIKTLKKMKGFSLEDPTDLCLIHIFVDDTLTQSLASYEPPVYLPQLTS